MAGQKIVRWIVFGVSNTDIGLGLMGMAKLIKLTLTVVKAQKRKTRMTRFIPKW
jgi:hypothetical protein